MTHTSLITEAGFQDSWRRHFTNTLNYFKLAPPGGTVQNVLSCWLLRASTLVFFACLTLCVKTPQWPHRELNLTWANRITLFHLRYLETLSKLNYILNIKSFTSLTAVTGGGEIINIRYTTLWTKLDCDRFTRVSSVVFLLICRQIVENLFPQVSSSINTNEWHSYFFRIKKSV